MTSLKVKLHDFFYEHIKILDQAQKKRSVSWNMFFWINAFAIEIWKNLSKTFLFLQIANLSDTHFL